MAFKNGSTLARLASIPLFNSAYQIAVFTYVDIKSVNPLVGFFCSVAEHSVSAVVGVAVTAATPVMQRLEVPIAAVNSVTLRGVDELEKRFPILDQSADEVLGTVRDSLATSLEQLQARAATRWSWLTERATGMVEDVMGIAALGVNTFLNATVLGQLLELGAQAALSRIEQIADHYLPALEEETRHEPLLVPFLIPLHPTSPPVPSSVLLPAKKPGRQVPSLTGTEQRPDSERAPARRLQLRITASARRAYRSAGSYAEALWRWMRWALNQLLDLAVELRRRLYRALVALTETGDSDSSPWPSFQQDPIRVQLVQKRRSSLGGKSSKASSDKNRVQDGAGHRSTPSLARRGLPTTLNRDPPAKKVRSPSPAASRLWEGTDLTSLGEEM